MLLTVAKAAAALSGIVMVVGVLNSAILVALIGAASSAFNVLLALLLARVFSKDREELEELEEKDVEA